MSEKQAEEEKRGYILQALLQEYANASQLYTNNIAASFARFFGFLAVHGALIVGFFTATKLQWLISCIGLIVAIITFLTVEYIWQYTEFRIAQAKEIERLINEKLSKAGIETKLTTFDRHITLFGKRKNIVKEKVIISKENGVYLPKGKWGACLINNLPQQADRITARFLIVFWIFLIIFSVIDNFELITTKETNSIPVSE